jgi:hypothetical protein
VLPAAVMRAYLPISLCTRARGRSWRGRDGFRVEREGMIARIDPTVEKALREAMGHVAHAQADQIEPALAALDDR